jgi:hypothetical protein
LRPGREFDPLQAKAQRGQALFQRALGLLQGQQAGGFLKADAQLLAGRLGPQRTTAQGSGAGQRTLEPGTAGDIEERWKTEEDMGTPYC